jgi:hypothetical protein
MLSNGARYGRQSRDVNIQYGQRPQDRPDQGANVCQPASEKLYFGKRAAQQPVHNPAGSDGHTQAKNQDRPSQNQARQIGHEQCGQVLDGRLKPRLKNLHCANPKSSTATSFSGNKPASKRQYPA